MSFYNGLNVGIIIFCFMTEKGEQEVGFYDDGKMNHYFRLIYYS